MQKLRLRTRAIGIALCCAVLFSAFSFMSSAINSTEKTQTVKTVRVGFFAFDGYHIMEGDGTYSGYGYDVIQKMSGYTDWNCEYVGYDKSWSEMQNMLADGEIDILTSAQKTEDRLELFDFSDENIGTSAAILTVKAGNSKFASNDYSNWNGIRVGMIKNNSRNNDFINYAQQKGFTYTTVYFDSLDEMINELKNGNSIDTVVTSNLRLIEDEWIIDQFAPSAFYIMVKKGNTQLLDEINFALSKVKQTEPEAFAGLMDKYYAAHCGTEIAFSAEERAFIESMKNVTFKALVNPDKAPLSYCENGELKGAVVDIAKEISQRSGLNIQLVQFNTQQEYTDALKNGDFDIRFDASDNYNRAEDNNCRLTSPYIETTVSKVYRRNTSEFHSVAVVKDTEIAFDIAEYGIDDSFQVFYYDTTDEAVKAVLSKEQDMALVYHQCADYIIYNDVTNSLTSSNVYSGTNKLCVAVKSDNNALVYSIINKAVLSMGSKDLDEIEKNYTSYEKKELTFVGYMYQNPFYMAGIVLIFFIMVFIILAYITIVKKRQNEMKQLDEEKRRTELLKDALATAESADAAKSQFLSRVSHEMRTPLNAIIGFITLAKNSPPEQVEVYHANCEIAAKQLLSVINDVLDMSAIESGNMKISHSQFDFKYLLNDITNMYYAQCSAKGVEYDTILMTPIDEWLVGDQLRVNQILLNLLGNAVKFTAKGHICLKVNQLEQTNANKVIVRFEVSDTGCGISDELLARLFKPFEQESEKTALKYGGSGLGLSIVKNLVSMMNGAVRVESTVGKGTVFTVDLPFEKSNSDVHEHVLAEGENIRVLVVDDEPADREYMSIVLNRMNVRHTSVSNGQDALLALDKSFDENDIYNICLIDWRMPNMNGIEITKKIREKYGKNVVVIVISAYECNQADENAKIAGADVFLPKPLFQSSLFDLFMTLTGGRASEKATGISEVGKCPYKGKRVLLAEDNEMNRMVAKGLVNKFGIECECANDGKIACEMFEKSEPGYYDAILMDIQMPNMNGFEATKAIRSLARADAREISIIALTANAFNDDITKSLSSGMNNHVTKPIDPSELLSALNNAFRHQKQ